LELIDQYFPNITTSQRDQYVLMWELYKDWNNKINVISRKDIENLYQNHILHSLAIAKFITFQDGSHILDLGTGGGFPGIPLAVYFPKVNFTLIDGTKKKIKVCNEVINGLGLTNVQAIQQRAEEHKKKYDMVVTRAVAQMDKLRLWTNKLIHNNHKNALPNGFIALKGGNILDEMKLLPPSDYYEIKPIIEYFSLPFYKDKYVAYVQH